MHKCPELRKLPKTHRISSVNFRRQTPGSIGNPNQQPPKPNIRLDPNHPIDLIPGKRKPFLWAPPTSAFSLGALPMGLLQKPEINSGYRRNLGVSYDSWGARLARGAPTGTVSSMILNGPHHTRLSMSVQTHSNRNFRIHQRVQIVRRFKTAVGLIATRGAAVTEVKGRRRLVFDEANLAESWILQGWTYYLRPSLEMYRMPYPELVNILRPALRYLWTRGTEMEAQWTAVSLSQRGESHGSHSYPHPPQDSRSPLRVSHGRFPDESQPPTNWRPSSKDTQFGLRTATQADPFSGPKNVRFPGELGRPPNSRPLSEDRSFSLRAETASQVDLPSGQKPRNSRQRNIVPPDLLPAVPDFDPFPTVRVSLNEPSASTRSTAKSESLTAIPTPPLNIDPQQASLPAEPDFNPFPSVPVIPADSSASGVPPTPPLKRNPNSSAKNLNSADWWGVGRKLEAAIGQDAEGATRWDRPAGSSRPSNTNRQQVDATGPAQTTSSRSEPKKERDSTQTRLGRMLYQRNEVVRPDSKDRAARQIPWQTHRFEEK